MSKPRVRRSRAFTVTTTERATNRHQFAINVPADLHQRITRKAEAEGVSLRALVLTYLQRWSAQS